MYKQEERICTCCNNTYSGNKTRKYCSYKCAKKVREKKKQINCVNCNISFVVQEHREAKYCSKKCKWEYNTSETIEVECTNCKKKFDRKEHRIRGKIFCSHICSSEYNRGKNHYEWKENLHDKHYKLALKQWGVSVKERDNYSCQYCSITDRKLLEAHHIEHRSKNIHKQFDLDNGITLCLWCHRDQHLDDLKVLRLINSKIKKHAENNNSRISETV